MKRFAIIFLLTICGAAVALAADNYQGLKKIPIPGQGSWDYLTVDDSARRLYVSHGTQVEVLDVDSGAIVGQIPNTLGVLGIAIAPESGRGFVSDGQDSTVTIFELKTLKSLAEVPTGKKPDAIYDPATARVFAFNGGATARPLLTLPAAKLRARSIWVAVPNSQPRTARAMSMTISRTRARW